MVKLLMAVTGGGLVCAQLVAANDRHSALTINTAIFFFIIRHFLIKSLRFIFISPRGNMVNNRV